MSEYKLMLETFRLLKQNLMRMAVHNKRDQHYQFRFARSAFFTSILAPKHDPLDARQPGTSEACWLQAQGLYPGSSPVSEPGPRVWVGHY
jgi:hypothetical protein